MFSLCKLIDGRRLIQPALIQNGLREIRSVDAVGVIMAFHTESAIFRNQHTALSYDVPGGIACVKLQARQICIHGHPNARLGTLGCRGFAESLSETFQNEIVIVAIDQLQLLVVGVNLLPTRS